MNALTERTLEHFARRWTTYAKAVTATAAVLVLLGSAATALGVMPVTQNQFRQLEIRVANAEADRWFFLDKKKDSPQGLTDRERQEWCKLGLRHGFIKSCA